MPNQPFVDQLVGKTVAQYTILAKLGGGGMGVVYQARDAKLGRLVALKFLPPQWSHDGGAKQRFIREAQAASATDHPNICTIHDIEATDDGQLFIVMAYYEGRTLKQTLEDGALPVEQALQIATQVAEGLAKAHAPGIVHRDIKPGNLMITEDGVRILDFGLAKFADSLQLTIAGSTLGTVAYMSPEQARGEEADQRSDLWAVGVVLYEMLTGETPFKGIYPEAISYAIRNDPPPPLRAEERHISTFVEQIVLRALQKDPADRYQTARELARDLRLAQGLTVPVDLRTEAVARPPGAQAAPSARRWSRRRVLAAGAAAIVALGGAAVWLSRPVARIPLAVAPVVNQTGDAALDEYRLALTYTLVTELLESPAIRALPYERLLQIERRFLSSGADIAGREAVQAIAAHTGARFVIVPTLLYESGAWRARAEVRDAETAVNVGVYETEPIVSSLNKDTAYGLMTSIVERVHQHFDRDAPLRLRVVNAVRSVTSRRPPAMTPPLRTLDAAAAFERGVNAYDDLQYANARHAFADAAQKDPQNPLVFAWLSHSAQILQLENVAREAADQASRLITPQTPQRDRLFVAAVSAESRREQDAAARGYRELAAGRPDESAWLIELGAFQYRRTAWTDAVITYRRALDLDDRLARPHLELCRLYNRLNEGASAKAEGERALAAYRAIGNRGGEGQALMCLTDMLRVGSDGQRAEARRNADAARRIFSESGDGYNLARAEYYVALAAEAQGRPTESIAVYEESLKSARGAGNVALEPLVLMNLGAMNGKVGRQSQALSYHQQSHDLFQSVGDEQRAAQSQADIGAILIEYAGRPADGLRNLQNALAVFQKIGDKKFEVFAAKVTAGSYRYAGRHADAERELNRALALARERDMSREIPALTIDLALSRFDMGQYGAARDLLVQALGDGSGKDSPQARLHLAATDTRLGAFAAAQTELTRAAIDIERNGDQGMLSLMYVVMGQLAYETGRTSDARTYFGKSSEHWTDNLPDHASVEARAYLGLLDALEDNIVRGRAAAQESLAQARTIGIVALEALCRAHLARIDVLDRKFDRALDTLGGIAPDRVATLNPELRAQLHYWRGRALAGTGDRAGAQSEDAAARTFIDDLRLSLPEAYRDTFASRPDIRVVGG